MEDTFEHLFIKCKTHTEPGNTSENIDHHGDLGQPHNHHHEEQQFEQSPPHGKNDDHAKKFHGFGDNNKIIA